MIDPQRICLFIPFGLKGFKQNLFERIGSKIGRMIRGDIEALNNLPTDIIPAVGCSPELRPTIDRWLKQKRNFIYWDRGYARRVFATDLPVGSDGGYYRWHLNAYQMREIREVPADRWNSLKTPVWPWQRQGRHIVLAEPSETYQRFHRIEGWAKQVSVKIKQFTKRPIISRNKEMQRFGRKLHEDLKNAHALVTHASNSAVEAVVMGCPVFVHPDSAASLVGLTDLSQIENPVYPERQQWLNSLAYHQWNERELVDGTLWRMIQ